MIWCANTDAIPSQVVDWSNGRAVVGDKESEILKLVNAASKDD